MARSVCIPTPAAPRRSGRALDCMKRAILILSAILSLVGCTLPAEPAATNSTAPVVPLHPLTDADWKFISAAQSRKPLSAMSITNRLSQNDILSICDPVSVHQGLARYLDGMCGFGSRLHRDYVGSASVLRVSFLWDGSPKVTRFSFYGTNAAAAASWQAEMLTALRTRLGAESVKVEVQPGGPANGSQPARSGTNRTSSAAGSRR